MRRAVELDLDTLTLSQQGRVITAVFADPPNHFLSLRLVKDMDRLSAAADRDPTVGAVILTGTGDRFISHSEPDQVRLFFEMSPPPVPERLLRWSIRANNLTLQMSAVRTLTEKRGGDWGAGIVYSTLLKRANLRMNRSGVVYIAAINGAALGGGFEMALACDLRFAADDERVQIGLIEILAGLIPGGGGIRRLTDIIGQAKAFEHMVEGRPLSAREAHSAGLIHGVSDPDVLIADTYRTAERLACRSPHAVAALKRSVYFNGRRRLSAAIDAELAAFVATGRNPRKREIATAFEADLDRLGDSPFAVDIEPWLHGTRRADGR